MERKKYLSILLHFLIILNSTILCRDQGKKELMQQSTILSQKSLSVNPIEEELISIEEDKETVETVMTSANKTYYANIASYNLNETNIFYMTIGENLIEHISKIYCTLEETDEETPQEHKDKNSTFCFIENDKLNKEEYILYFNNFREDPTLENNFILFHIELNTTSFIIEKNQISIYLSRRRKQCEFSEECTIPAGHPLLVQYKNYSEELGNFLVMSNKEGYTKRIFSGELFEEEDFKNGRIGDMTVFYLNGSNEYNILFYNKEEQDVEIIAYVQLIKSKIYYTEGIKRDETKKFYFDPPFESKGQRSRTLLIYNYQQSCFSHFYIEPIKGIANISYKSGFEIEDGELVLPLDERFTLTKNFLRLNSSFDIFLFDHVENYQSYIFNIKDDYFPEELPPVEGSDVFWYHFKKEEVEKTMMINYDVNLLISNPHGFWTVVTVNTSLNSTEYVITRERENSIIVKLKEGDSISIKPTYRETLIHINALVNENEKMEQIPHPGFHTNISYGWFKFHLERTYIRVEICIKPLNDKDFKFFFGYYGPDKVLEPSIMFKNAYIAHPVTKDKICINVDNPYVKRLFYTTGDEYYYMFINGDKGIDYEFVYNYLPHDSVPAEKLKENKMGVLTHNLREIDFPNKATYFYIEKNLIYEKKLIMFFRLNGNSPANVFAKIFDQNVIFNYEMMQTSKYHLFITRNYYSDFDLRYYMPEEMYNYINCMEVVYFYEYSNGTDYDEVINSLNNDLKINVTDKQISWKHFEYLGDYVYYEVHIYNTTDEFVKKNLINNDCFFISDESETGLFLYDFTFENFYDIELKGNYSINVVAVQIGEGNPRVIYEGVHYKSNDDKKDKKNSKIWIIPTVCGIVLLAIIIIVVVVVVKKKKKKDDEFNISKNIDNSEGMDISQ